MNCHLKKYSFFKYKQIYHNVSRQRGVIKMAYKLFQEIVLTKDIPEKKLKKGDVATIVNHHPVSNGDDGYSLEVFDVLGNIIAVITLPESSIEPLTENEIFNVRSLEVV